MSFRPGSRLLVLNDEGLALLHGKFVFAECENQHAASVRSPDLSVRDILPDGAPPRKHPKAALI